jgi:phosphatidylglycerophosphate synthase
MPEPISYLATDRIFYDYLYNPLAEYICFLNPNHITVACFLMLIPLVVGLLKRWPLWIMILIMFVRQSLDCLDGAVARKCKKTSKLGAVLDVAEDVTTYIVLAALASWVLWQKRISPWILYTFIGINIYVLSSLISQLYYKMNDVAYPLNTLQTFLHDNTIVLLILVVVGIHTLIHTR